MQQISISDISKNPSIIDKFQDIVEILNKKTKQIKGVYIPYSMIDSFKDVFEELEYKKFVARNKSLQSSDKKDSTLLDGLDDEY